MGYSFSEESLSIGAVVDDSSLHWHLNTKMVSVRSIYKDAGFFSVVEQDVQLEAAEMGGIACVSKFKDK